MATPESKGPKDPILERTESLDSAAVETLIRAAMLNGEIDPEVAMTIAKLLYTSAALSKGDSYAKITLKLHDTTSDGGELRKHGKYGICVACIKVETKFGHSCAVIAPGSSRCCLIPSSRVLGVNGVPRKVESLVIGDRILAANQSRNALVETKVISILDNHLRDSVYEINSELSITGDHPVLVFTATGEHWKRVDELLVGDQLLSVNGSSRVGSIRKLNIFTRTMYIQTDADNFLVAGETNNYLVSGDYAAPFLSAILDEAKQKELVAEFVF